MLPVRIYAKFVWIQTQKPFASNVSFEHTHWYTHINRNAHNNIDIWEAFADICMPFPWGNRPTFCSMTFHTISSRILTFCAISIQKSRLFYTRLKMIWFGFLRRKNEMKWDKFIRLLSQKVMGKFEYVVMLSVQMHVWFMKRAETIMRQSFRSIILEVWIVSIAQLLRRVRRFL